MFTTSLKENDIICGRSSIARTHIGNYHFRKLINEYRLQYQHATRKEKHNIIEQIISIIISKRNGRFLHLATNYKQLPQQIIHMNHDYYQDKDHQQDNLVLCTKQATYTYVYQKVSHALRSTKGTTNTNNKRGMITSTTTTGGTTSLNSMMMMRSSFGSNNHSARCRDEKLPKPFLKKPPTKATMLPDKKQHQDYDKDTPTFDENVASQQAINVKDHYYYNIESNTKAGIANYYCHYHNIENTNTDITTSGLSHHSANSNMRKQLTMLSQQQGTSRVYNYDDNAYPKACWTTGIENNEMMMIMMPKVTATTNVVNSCAIPLKMPNDQEDISSQYQVASKDEPSSSCYTVSPSPLFEESNNDINNKRNVDDNDVVASRPLELQEIKSLLQMNLPSSLDVISMSEEEDPDFNDEKNDFDYLYDNDYGNLNDFDEKNNGTKDDDDDNNIINDKLLYFDENCRGKNNNDEYKYLSCYDNKILQQPNQLSLYDLVRDCKNLKNLVFPSKRAAVITNNDNTVTNYNTVDGLGAFGFDDDPNIDDTCSDTSDWSVSSII